MNPARLYRPQLITPAVREAGIATVFSTVFADCHMQPSFTRFLRLAFEPQVTSVAEIAWNLGVNATSMSARFSRAGLPPAGEYVARAHLVWVAQLACEPSTHSLRRISFELGNSSSTHLGRTIRALTGLSGAEFRREYSRDRATLQFWRRLVWPYRDVLARFNPLPSRTTARRSEAA